MAGGKPPGFKSFKCPHCQALYHIVEVEAGPETVFQEVTCCVAADFFPLGKESSCSNTSCCEKLVVFKSGAPIERPSQLPRLAGASRWSRSMRGSPLLRTSPPDIPAQ